MKIISEPNEWVIKEFAPAFSKKEEGVQYRYHRYILFASGDEGEILLYNVLTHELVQLEDGDNIFSQHFFDNLWLVPNEFSDESLAVSIKMKLWGTRRKGWAPMGYTILTTTKCNARCFYCYERTIKKKNMTLKVAKDVGEYIVKNYLKYGAKKNGGAVPLSWFGGEPLYNQKVIDVITGILKKNNVPYASSMISNSYLFDEDTVRKAKADWNLKSVQVTIDGTEKYYNKAKNFIYKDDPNPFETLMRNIDYLTRYGIRTTVRVNVGYYNHKDIKDLIKVLHDRFGGRSQFSVYAHTLFESGGITDINTEERERVVIEEMEKIEDLLVEYKLQGPKGVSRNIKSTHCMADNGQHAVIQCNGDITLCEHYVDSQKFASIYSDEKNVEIYNKFHEHSEPLPQCYMCPMFPECSALKMCEDNDISCNDVKIAYRINKKTKEIVNTLKMFKKQKENGKENGRNQTGNNGGNRSITGNPATFETRQSPHHRRVTSRRTP